MICCNRSYTRGIEARRNISILMLWCTVVQDGLLVYHASHEALYAVVGVTVHHCSCHVPT